MPRAPPRPHALYMAIVCQADLQHMAHMPIASRVYYGVECDLDWDLRKAHSRIEQDTNIWVFYKT